MSVSRIVGITTLIGIAVGFLPATRDEVRWRFSLLHDDVQSYAKYLASWPAGRHASEARRRNDESSWSDAQANMTVDAYRQYEQTHPQGVHLDEARIRIEQLEWKQATNADTVRSLGAYIQAYPNGRFVADAQAGQAALRADQVRFADALKTGTEHALKQFLSDFPDHSRQAEALQALKDITERRDIVDLLSEKKIEIQTRGRDIQSVSVRVRKLVPYPLTVRIPVGSYFVSASRSSQNMVTTEESSVSLTTDGWENVSPPVACANRALAIPGDSDSFTIQRSPHQADLAKLIPELGRAGVSFATRQAAVWIVTDDASYSDLGTLTSRGIPIIWESDAARAMKICTEAGIEITRKAIWKDRQTILNRLRDDSLKKWLEEKQ